MGMSLCANWENNGDESEKFWSDDEEMDNLLIFFALLELILFSVLFNPFQANVHHFYTPCKHQKTRGFLMFLGGIEMEYSLEIG